MVTGAHVTLSSGGANYVPAIEVYGTDAWLSADEARQLARVLIEAVDEMDASPLPNANRADA